MVISLAKKEELIYVQERAEPIRLSRSNHGLRLCQQVRDEAHRFAQHYHHVLQAEEDDRGVGLYGFLPLLLCSGGVGAALYVLYDYYFGSKPHRDTQELAIIWLLAALCAIGSMVFLWLTMLTRSVAIRSDKSILFTERVMIYSIKRTYGADTVAVVNGSSSWWYGYGMTLRGRMMQRSQFYGVLLDSEIFFIGMSGDPETARQCADDLAERTGLQRTELTGEMGL
jgi:hypothetical protein